MPERNEAEWKQLSPEQEKKIVKLHSKSACRNDILREFGISNGQYISIIKRNSSKENEKGNFRGRRAR